MTKKEIKSIILHLDSAAAIDYLTDEQAGILIKAILRYGRNGQMLESSDTALTALFTMLCTQIDRDHRKYEERCERNVVNAKKRYEPVSEEHLSLNLTKASLNIIIYMVNGEKQRKSLYLVI